MFNATNGKKVFDRLYEEVLRSNDPDLWYEGGYSTWRCWGHAAGDAYHYIDGEGMGTEDTTDLMAYIVKCNPDEATDAFGDGFGYLLGTMMEDKYEEGE